MYNHDQLYACSLGFLSEEEIAWNIPSCH
jgi:hypothetical protein